MNKLKYFFEYTNTVNDFYRFEINQVGFAGDAIEINGRAVINKASVQDHIEPFRGTSVTVSLEASEELTLSDLIAETEFDFPVTLYKNGSVYFKGYLNPDGAFQSYTRSNWQIQLECIDGLGALENLSFVDDSGIFFVGKTKAIDIIFNCLKRTGTDQRVNICVNVFFEGYVDTESNNIFNSIQFNADRYIKDDGDTIMSCGEVLKSVLDTFSAVITQYNGEWYIYRSSEVAISGFVNFKKYETDKSYLGTILINLNKDLGSHIDDFYPHHCGENQTLQVKGATSAYRINYKYGLLKGLISNSKLIHDKYLNYNDWILDSVGRTYLINDPDRSSGFLINPQFTEQGGVRDIIPLGTASSGRLEAGSSINFECKIATNGIAFLSVFVSINNEYYLTNSGEWTNARRTALFFEITEKEYWSMDIINLTYSVSSKELPVDGFVSIEVIVPHVVRDENDHFATRYDINSIDIINNSAEANNLKGEFHTAERGEKTSSNIKDNKEVFNGDGVNDIYIGSIYKLDGSLTELWNRKGYSEKKLLLRIAAEDYLRLSQSNAKIFYGDFYGYIPYLSLVSINKLSGKFLPIEYSYDTYSNIGNAKWMEVFSRDLPNINYSLTYDYGTTVKPTISS